MADEIIPKEEVVVEAPIEPVSEPVQDPEAPTAQIPVNEPLATPTETPSEPEAEPTVETPPEELPPSASLPEEKPLASSESVTEEIKPEIFEPVSEPIQTESKPAEQIHEIKSEPLSEFKPEPEQPKPIPEVIPAVAIISKSKSLARELLIKARNAIQSRKRKKLDKIMTLFLKKQKITNDEVEKFMHVSDATATRYLSQLEKEGKIKQTGKTGKSVFYTKI